MIDEPAVRPAYGGLLAGPVFSEIAQRSLRYLNVAPDKNSISVGKISTKLPVKRAVNVKEGSHAKKRRRL
jgi:cell division protein FtsI (penicillin-binding protein 3)